MIARTCFTTLLLSALALEHCSAADPQPIVRVLPPEGLEIPANVQERLVSRLAETKRRLAAEAIPEFQADIEIFTKAVELALLHREFYVEKDFSKADAALDEANKRLDALKKGEHPWTKATGLVVRGYPSSIDKSAQPYGLVIPQGHDLTKPAPLYVWLHGRGDKNTDLHFLDERARRSGQITPAKAIVLHPFGRHCVGWKHAGEIDVLEAIESVKASYSIDVDRIVLIGFSMGGAGAWHIGAHYTDRFVAVSPGAGFAETARYQRLTPDEFPPSIEQKLWGLYDVPDYVRNLFNTQTIAYSGENDPQIQAARIMEQAFQSEGRKLEHLIGPGVKHQYEPKTLEQLLKQLEAVVVKGREKMPQQVHLQTRTLRYPKMHWVEALGLQQHWEDSRVDAEVAGNKTIKVTTKNVTALLLTPNVPIELVTIDGQDVPIKADAKGAFKGVTLVKSDNRWSHWTAPTSPHPKQSKVPMCQGPIDDVFIESFVVVTPTGKSKSPAFQAWVDAELSHFRARWRALMRGELPEVKDVDFNIEKPAANQNLVLWGDADSNKVIKHLGDQLLVKFGNGNWSLGGQEFDGNRFVPVYIAPPPPQVNQRRYIVLNSGLTFREGHDRTNSLQNPKLPDWAIIDITQPPNAVAPGRIHDAGFFDENWQLKSPPKAP